MSCYLETNSRQTIDLNVKSKNKQNKNLFIKIYQSEKTIYRLREAIHNTGYLTKDQQENEQNTLNRNLHNRKSKWPMNT